MMRCTSSFALLKSSDISVTTLCLAAAVNSALALLFGGLVRCCTPCSTLSAQQCAIVQQTGQRRRNDLEDAATASGVARGPAFPSTAPRRHRRSPSVLSSVSELASSAVAMSRGLGGLSFDVSGLRFDFGGGLPAQPDRAGPGTRGGSSRLRLGRLCLRFLREGKCICARRPTDQGPASVHRRCQRRSPTRGA